MSERTGAAGIFSRPRPRRPPEPAADKRKAPYGWIWDSKLSAWRPKKTRGKVAAGQARGRAPRKRKGQAPAARTVRQPLAEVLPDPDDDEDQEAAAERELLDPDASWQDEGEGSEQDPDTAPVPGPSGSVRDDIGALIALSYQIPAELMGMWDPYCFDALSEDQVAVPVVTALTDIVCASPRVAAWAASASGLMPFIRIGYALKPVVGAAIRHHVTRSVEVEVDREERTIKVVKRDYSQYTAA